MPKHGVVDPAQEAEWSRHKAECYARWRAERMAKGLAFLNAAKDTVRRKGCLQAVLKKYGKRFAADLEQMWRDQEKEKHADQSSA